MRGSGDQCMEILYNTADKSEVHVTWNKVQRRGKFEKPGNSCAQTHKEPNTLWQLGPRIATCS